MSESILRLLVQDAARDGVVSDATRRTLLKKAVAYGVSKEDLDKMIQEALRNVAHPTPPPGDNTGSTFEQTPPAFTPPPAGGEGSTFNTSAPPPGGGSESWRNSRGAGSSTGFGSSSGFGSSPGFTDVEPLGQQGAMSYLQKAQYDRRWVVVKRLLPQHRQDPGYIDLLYKEYHNGRDLRHEHIVDVYGRGKDEEGPYFYMEYVDGQALSRRIPPDGIKDKDEWLIRRIATQILEALNYAHKKQVFHRDLKPDNILITTRGDNVKLIDFGLAATDSYDDIARASFVGTRKYAAPEQTTDPTRVDGRADLYAFGLILLEMFTGSTDRRDLGKIGKAHWRNLIQKCLQKDPADRYPDAKEILNEIEWHSSSEKADAENKAREEAERQRQRDWESQQQREREQQRQRELEEQQRRDREEQRQREQQREQQRQREAELQHQRELEKQRQREIERQNKLLREQKQEQERQEKKLRQSQKPRRGGCLTTFLWTILIIGALVAFGFYRIANFLGLNDQGFNGHSEDDLRGRVTAYYQALETHDFDQVASYYEPRLRVYFTRRNVDADDMRAIHTKYWGRTPEDRHEILWNTFRYEIAPDEESVTLTYDMKYHYRRATGGWQVVEAHTVVKMNEDLRMFYIAGK